MPCSICGLKGHNKRTCSSNNNYACNNIRKKKYIIKENIIIDDIEVFDIKVNRSKNDENNKIRENIIYQIINDSIPKDFYEDQRWENLKNEICKYLKKLKPHYNTVICNIKAGRNNHFDLDIIFDNNTEKKYPCEFKSNAESVDELPQIASLSKPSQYLKENYEKNYYDNYLGDLLCDFNLEMPNKEDYMKEIHSTEPMCMKSIQEKYYKGNKNSSKFTKNTQNIDFYKKAKDISKNSIENFVKNTDLDCNKLTEHLLKTQSEKYYMLYKNKKIKLQKLEIDNYKIISYEKEKNTYIAKTKAGSKLYILLRWKNGNGIAYPALQIKLKFNNK